MRARPTRSDEQMMLDGLPSVAANLGKIKFGSGSYELPATPIADPTVTVADANVKIGATILICLTSSGGVMSIPVAPKAADVTVAGTFDFVIFTDGETPTSDYFFNYIIKNA